MGSAGVSGPVADLKVPVLVVGAGPVGLALALELGWRGVEVLVIDQLRDQQEGIRAHPRAAAVVPRTMEFCRRWGVAGLVRNAGFPRDFHHNEVSCTSLDGYLLTLQEFPSMNDRAPLPFSPEIRERCPQIWFDPILEMGLESYLSVRKRRGWRLDSFVDDGTAVRSVVTDVESGRQTRVTSDYLVACDGPASGVRDALGVVTTGKGILSYSLNAVLEIPDFLARHDKGPAERYFFVDETGTWANLTVIDGRDRWRFTLTGSAASQDRSAIDLDAAITRALGPSVPYTIIAEASWRRRESIAERFKVGRVLLAGDAAHTMPPDLGMGMNTGIGDSVDLGWKLQAVLEGWGDPYLLETYEIERKPVAVRNASASTRAHLARRTVSNGHPGLLQPGEDGDEARAQVRESMLSKFSDAWDTNGLALGYTYDGSPLCLPDGTPASEDDGSISRYEQSARPGGRAPHAWLPDGRSTLDLFGKGFVLLRVGAADGDLAPLVKAADDRGVPLSVTDLDGRDLADLFENALVLVRPDGHVAWRGDTLPDDCLDLVDQIRGVPVKEHAGSPAQKEG